MNRALRRALAIVSIAVAVALATTAIVYLANARDSVRPAPATNRPRLLLLTGLPLLFSEDFSLTTGGSPVLKALQRRYRVVPISVTDPAELAKGSLLLMAQPQAQSPENLVALDQWVRNGGRLLLLADPMLEWPSELPLGDPSRPPPMFVDTGLLVHWGLRLDAPDEREPAERMLGGDRVLTVSPGALFGQCAISANRLVAHCRIGKGEVTVVADADFLDVQQLGTRASGNLDSLNAELASLAHS